MGLELNTPKLYSKWKHYNGNVYTVLLVTNLYSLNIKYPPTVVYVGENMKTWSRVLTDWNRSFTELK